MLPKQDCDNCEGSGKWYNLVLDQYEECPCVGGPAMKKPDPTYEEGVQDAAADIADWLRSGVAGSMYGSETWTIRRSLAEALTKGYWRNTRMVDDRFLPRTTKKSIK